MLARCGPGAVADWRKLQELMKPLAQAATAVSPAYVRSDLGAVLTLGKALPKLLAVQPAVAAKLLRPFSEAINGEITDPFVRNWLDMLCFLLCVHPPRPARTDARLTAPGAQERGRQHRHACRGDRLHV